MLSSPSRPRYSIVLGLALAGIVLGGRRPILAGAEQPLHERIDQLIAASLVSKPAARSSDTEFLRRVSLDLTGMIPSVEQTRQFLADPSPEKRRQLVESLLASPHYARHMQNVFDVLLMERRPDQNVPSGPWRELLRDWFAENKPYDEMVQTILAADGVDAEHRAEAKFFLDRAADPNEWTRDVARLFLGMDLQCAQCHDHPLVDEYKQEYYYGIYAFLDRSFFFTDKKKQVMLAEKAEGETTFVSVFEGGDPESIGPRLPGTAPVDEPALEKGSEYVVAPADGVRPVPAFSRRAQLASQLTGAENPAFSRNAVNRFWALMMGRGLVEPLDRQHVDNPPSHPELLGLLAAEFVASRYDIRHLLRELALSETYQRASIIPADMSTEDATPERFAVAMLKPLTPEQLAWSVMQALGQRSLSQQTAQSELRAADPKFFDILQADPPRRARQAVLVENAVFEKLGGQVGPFVGLFGKLPGQPQDAPSAPTVHQALFIANGEPIRGWLQATGDNLIARLVRLDEDTAMAEELYLSLLSRLPGELERADIAAQLAEQGEPRDAVIRELAWGLLASAEFRFNH